MRRIAFHFGWIFLLFVAFIALIPSFVSNGRTPLNDIINNLRQIDGAKQAHAMELAITNRAHVFSEADLAPFLGRSGEFPSPVIGERYLIKSLAMSPEALLTRKIHHAGVTYLPGTVLRLTTNGEWEASPPTGR